MLLCGNQNNQELLVHTAGQSGHAWISCSYVSEKPYLVAHIFLKTNKTKQKTLKLLKEGGDGINTSYTKDSRLFLQNNE